MEEEDYIPDSQDISQGEMDQAQDIYEVDSESKEEQDLYGNYPVSRDKDSVFTFFKQLLHLSRTTRVGNVNPKSELGMLQFSVRTNEYLALVGKTLGDHDFEKFWVDQSEIITSTSMAKDGWLTTLPISQKRFASRTVRPIRTEGKGFLGFGKKGDQSAAAP